MGEFCALCESEPAAFRCVECTLPLCAACRDQTHGEDADNDTRSHTVLPLADSEGSGVGGAAAEVVVEEAEARLWLGGELGEAEGRVELLAGEPADGSADAVRPTPPLLHPTLLTVALRGLAVRRAGCP